MAISFLSDVTINGGTTINLDSGSAFTINEPDKDQQGRLIFSYSSGDPTLTIASRGSTAKLHIRSDATSNGLYLDEDGQIYVNNSISDGVRINGTSLASIGTNANKLDLGSSSRPWGDIYSTGSYVNTLTLSSIATASSETVSALFEESGAVVKKDLGTNAFSSATIPTDNSELDNGAGYLTSLSGAVLTTTNQTIAGTKTFSENAKFPGPDGGVEIGTWAHSSSYGFIGTKNMADLEYAMIFDGTNTLVGAGTEGSLKLRGPANDSSPSIVINGTTCTVDNGTSVGQGTIRAKYNSSDNSTGVTSTFTVRNGNNSASLTFTIKDGIVTGIST